MAQQQRGDPWPWHLGMLAGYLLLGVLATWPLTLHVTTAVPGFDSPATRGGMADQDVVLWVQWWVGAALRHGQDPLSTDLLYWPTYRDGLSLVFQEMQLVRTALALPVQWTLGPAAGYNLGVFLSFMLGGYGTWLLARDRGLSRPAAALAGLVYVAGPYHLMQLFWETALIAAEALPFALLWTWRALRDGDRRAIGLAALCIVWANLSNWYFGIYALIALGVLAVGIAWRQRRAGWGAIRAVLGRAGVIGVGYLLLFSPILVPVLAQVAAADPASRLFVSLGSIRGASMHWFDLFLNQRDPLVSPSIWHGTSFLGYTTLALAGLGMGATWRRAVPWVVLFGVYLNLAMGPDLHGFGNLITFPNGEPVPLPYAFLLRLPGMNLLRSPAHANIMLLLCAALLAGVGFDAVRAWIARLQPPRPAWLPGVLAGGVAILMLGEYLVLPLPLYTLRWASIFTEIGQDPARYAIFELPVTLHASNDHHRMFNQIAHGKGIAGAYLPRPLPDPYRALDSPFARFTQPYTTTDVLAQDEQAATIALLQLHDFRYLAVYHDRKDYRVGDSPWDWPALGPAVEDPEVTVSRVPPAALDRVYLYLGNSWSLPERAGDTARRWLGPDPGYLLAWSPGTTGRLTLALDLPPVAPARAITLTLDSQPVLTATLAAGPALLTTPPLTLPPGWHTFRLTAAPLPGDTPVRRVALRRAAWEPGP